MTKPSKWHVRLAKTDQPGHPPSLIRVLAVGMKKALVLSYPLSAQGRLIRVLAVGMKKALVLSYPLSAQGRLIRLRERPGCAESSLGAHSFCWFCHVMAHFLETWSNVHFLVQGTN